MKVICVDNYDRESVSDSLIAENLDVIAARELAQDLNEQAKGSDAFFRVVPDGHKLYKFEP